MKLKCSKASSAQNEHQGSMAEEVDVPPVVPREGVSADCQNSISLYLIGDDKFCIVAGVTCYTNIGGV